MSSLRAIVAAMRILSLNPGLRPRASFPRHRCHPEDYVRFGPAAAFCATSASAEHQVFKAVVARNDPLCSCCDDNNGFPGAGQRTYSGPEHAQRGSPP
jgi:hypothetical protein